MQGKGNTYSLVERELPCTANREISVVKLRMDLPQDSAIPLLGIQTKDSTFYYRHLLMHVHCCSTHNSQKLERA